ncbi:L,D-transpeptidase [Mycolicibacterium chitae]|uniref:ErfK/YbiS/YcfS/YnhG family protein n=1 Tax=Mycolicibacterium chitae TaxID=1792 RepID=A0A448ID61_MYCCI|nr:L,D-transpeptidase [Mycolicibacterium chitae]VEG50386.1 ErfK/YbiS/YcfS/YnhG family protein [Mycolicibacterium chitae]
MTTVRQAFGYVLALLGVVTLTQTAWAAVGTAAVPTPTADVSVVDVQPRMGSQVGVAHPIVVTFGEPVADRARAERSIRVVSPAAVTGEYDWISPNTVHFVPDDLWPAHSEIKLLAGGMPMSFRTGAAVTAVADISAYTFTVSIDGEVVRQMPASMGKSKFPTPQGRFTVLGKENPVVMDSRTIGIPLDDPEGYKLTVNHAVRITWGGVYIHSAPWSVGSQGYANVSHGCINLSPDNAAWYYNNVGIGDLVTVQA